jgi:hypothetical protein
MQCADDCRAFSVLLTSLSLTPGATRKRPASSHLLLFLNLPNSDIGIAIHSHTPGSDKKINGHKIVVHFFQFFRADLFFVVGIFFHKKPPVSSGVVINRRQLWKSCGYLPGFTCTKSSLIVFFFVP